MFIKGTEFKIINFVVPLWVFLIIFLIIAVVSISLYLFLLLRRNDKITLDRKQITNEEFLKKQDFIQEKEYFELELSQVKKIIRKK